MAAPDPLAGTAEAFADADWKETVAAAHTGGGDHFGGDGGGEAALVGVVDDAKARGCLRYVLGYNAVTPAAPYTLERTLPIRHPRWEHLIATAVTSQPFVPDPKKLKRPAEQLVGTATDRFVLPTLQGYAGYKKNKITVRFEPEEYALLEDDFVPTYTPATDAPPYSFPAEWARFTVFNTDPKVDYLEQNGTRLMFAEGDAEPTGPKGIPYPAAMVQILAKPDLTVTTHRLPRNFLFPDNTYTPQNIIAGLGTVNRYDFEGFAAGTLLFLGAKLTRKRWALQLGKESTWLWTMEVLFSVFDPPKGYQGGVPINTNKGHNNMPFWGKIDPTTKAAVSGDVNAGKWFLATRTGGASDNEKTDPRLIPSFDIAQLWRPVANGVDR